MIVFHQLKAVAKLGTLAPYRNIEHFVLINGRLFRPAPFPKGMRRRPFEFCFGNSQRLAKRKRLIYVEGYAMNRHRRPGGPSRLTGTVVDLRRNKIRTWDSTIAASHTHRRNSLRHRSGGRTRGRSSQETYRIFGRTWHRYRSVGRTFRTSNQRDCLEGPQLRLSQLFGRPVACPRLGS
jgi:hypothetical protein